MHRPCQARRLPSGCSSPSDHSAPRKAAGSWPSAWSLTTLAAVARGDQLTSRLGVTFSEHAGLYDIQLENPGNLDSAWPAQITLKANNCEGADALAGYSLQQSADLLTFTRLRDGRLPAGGRRAIGWARCATIDQGGSHVVP